MDRSQIFLIDRDGGAHGLLGALVPGAVTLQIGQRGVRGAAINPWDVDDVRAVPAAKLTFLMRLQALLIGEHERSGDPLGLSARERELVERGVRDVYALAAARGRRPLQRDLRAALSERARGERDARDGSPDTAATYLDLAARLRDVCDAGRFAHLLDGPTRIDAPDAPLVVLDTSLVPEEVAAAVTLVIVEYVSDRMERWPASRIALLADVVDAPSAPERARFPAPFASESPLNGLHDSYLRRRVRSGETRGLAYLHAISDVSYFLHPPPGFGEGAGAA